MEDVDAVDVGVGERWSIRGMEGPVKSMSRIPTRVVGEDA